MNGVRNAPAQQHARMNPLKPAERNGGPGAQRLRRTVLMPMKQPCAECKPNGLTIPTGGRQLECVANAPCARHRTKTG